MNLAGVKLVHFNPYRPVLSGWYGRLLPVRRRLNNFGDLLGPLVVRGMLKERAVEPGRRSSHSARLLSVGSILHFARTGDVVWGTGRNGKIADSAHRFEMLDVRAVRGPLTREFLEKRGIRVPAVYGDPGLLVARIFPDLVALRRTPKRPFLYVPNFNDLPRAEPSDAMLDPRGPVMDCLKAIAESELVVGSSLHAVIVAEALGIPARLIRSCVEDEFKYADYYLGTGRASFKAASSLGEALRIGGERPPEIDVARLVDAFPLDLWTAA